MYSHDLEVMGLNPIWVTFGVHATSKLYCNKKNIIRFTIYYLCFIELNTVVSRYYNV